MSDDTPGAVILDAGPIIGAMYEDDEFHGVSARGLRRLAMRRSQVLVPVPVVFEVYKRLTYDVGPALARQGLDIMQSSMTPLFVEPDDLVALQSLVELMPWWGGSLEDATVAMLGLVRDVPVWTYNFRDLRAFPNLQFWTPG